MKTAKEWVDENSQSGPFDMILSCKEAAEVVRDIQIDATSEIVWWLNGKLFIAMHTCDGQTTLGKNEINRMINKCYPQK